MFLGIGHIPNAKIFEGQLDADADGYLKTHKYVFTKVHGVYACGTCRTAAIARPSPPPVRDAWQRSKPKDFWKKRG